MNSNQNMGKLEVFLENYGNFIGECTNNPNDLQTLIKDFSSSLPAPPEHCSTNQQIQQLYKKGQNLSKESTSNLVTKLRSLRQQKLQELVVNIEQLHVSLNNEYERQINRAIQLGIYSKGNPGSN